MSWYDVIKDFRELIVGVVGFGGVILTILYTAREAPAFDATMDIKKIDVAAIEAARHV